jgi:hypothetical protein
MTTKTKRTAKKTTSSTAKKSASTGTTKAPSGTRKAGNRKSSTSKSARAASGIETSSKKTTSKSTSKSAAKTTKATKTTKKAASKTSKSVKAKSRTVKSVRGPGKKKRASRKQVEDIVHNSVAPEMAEAMLGEMDLGNEDAALEREAAREQREREVLGRLAVAMNRHDDMPNQELAAEIVFHLDGEAVDVLVRSIERGDDIHASDSSRVLCEVGSRDEELLHPVQERLLTMVREGHDEMLPFAMYALSPLCHRVAEHLWELRENLWNVLSDCEEESELGRAAAVRLLGALCASGPDYARTLAGGLVDLLGKCMPKDVALYAESVLPALGTAHSHRAKPVLDRRMKELTPAEVARLRRAVRLAQTGGYSAAA